MVELVETRSATFATVHGVDTDATLARLGVRVPDVLLPRPDVDLHAWAVIACDQFTSQPEYWAQVAEQVGDRPSTLRLIFPEVYLEQDDPQARIRSINDTMTRYLADGLLTEHPHTFVLVRRRTAADVVRWGLMVALDLEQYSWEPDARTLIRATEGTILDRLPPRVAIRRDAALELPHILVLVNDGARSVIEPLAAATDRLTTLYHTRLMLDGGQVTGWAVDAATDQAAVANALTVLHDSLDAADPLLFAMGDGNHSFATAKSIWTDLRATLPSEEWNRHPARYCLVELANLHDPGLQFEPIHRVLFGVAREVFERHLSAQCASFERTDAGSLPEVLTAIERSGDQAFGHLDARGCAVYRLHRPAATLAAGTLQATVDALVAAGEGEVDYIHGVGATAELGSREGNLGLLLPQVDKSRFFDAITADGALPRKTFSLGEACDKRYYLEARRIRD